MDFGLHVEQPYIPLDGEGVGPQPDPVATEQRWAVSP
jgi:hypothetical protein